ncbi:iron ABC transporter permease [Microbulbifer sp. 2201CG32-9]|uniref:FecCD family ABC transporter permease n=1 Tax=Microbulbifer sp. 2201CG32-9 TaxID=3232309 RepID=UPI00345BA305
MMRWPVPSVLLGLLLLLLTGAILSLVQGAMQLPAIDGLLSILDSLMGTHYSQLEAFQRVVVVELRLPRMLLAIFVGAILAQSGAVLQGLFRNPLADPGIIGTSSGAAVGAIVAIVWFADSLGNWTIPFSAFASGLATTLLVYGLAKSKNGTSVIFLLLAGVAIAAFAQSLIGFISYFTDDRDLRALSLWQMGSLTGASVENLLLTGAVMILLAVFFQRKSVALNALLLGEPEARHMGINVERLKLQLIVVTAIGVGFAVSIAGIIGFVGLVVPHLIRLTTGPNHKSLLPLSALCGAALMVIADLLARLVVQPAELPVGLVTALFGAPFFITLLVQQRRYWSE